MVAVCLYLFVHQPYRLKRYRVYDIGHDNHYFDDDLNKYVFSKVSQNSYLPTNKLLLKLLRQQAGKFKLSICISGVALEQMIKYEPQVLESFQALGRTGHVEFVSGTYHQSLSSKYSLDEFKHQAQLHRSLIKKYFNQEPKVMRNTGLMYNDEIAKIAQELGFEGILVDAQNHVRVDSDLAYLYTSQSAPSVTLLPKHVKLSEDISKRFSDRSWREWPLTAEKYNSWITKINGGGDIVNMFMPYEIFGEHHGQETGILDFIEHFPKAFLADRDNVFVTPTQAIRTIPKRRSLSAPNTILEQKMQGSLHEMWTGNDMQQDALRKLFDLERELKVLNDQDLLSKWRKLSTSDHFFYMNTVTFRTGSSNKNNIYGSPYDAYLYFINALSDLKYQMNVKKLAMEKDIILQRAPSQTKSPLEDVKSAVNYR